MAEEHSFDIASKIPNQEVINAVNQAMKEISQRFDFRDSKSNIEFNQNNQEITLLSDDEYKLKAVIDVLQTKLVKRGISLKALNYSLQQGIPIENAKEIVKMIKNAKLKVQSEIQKDQVRVKSKKIDELQKLIKLIKEIDFDIHIEFLNYR
jgi:uncharacterized protein YajQ (UPF0234 family)